MRQTVTIFILILVLAFDGKSQTADSTFSFLSNCISLQNNGLLKESRDCFLEHDTSIYAIQGAAIISQQLNDTKSFKSLSKKLLSKQYASPKSYKLCADLYVVNSSKFIQIINKGLSLFVNDTILLACKTNYFLTKKDYVNAIQTIDNLVRHKKVLDKNLFFSKGCAYDGLKDNFNALYYYNKAVGLDSNYYDPYFNIAVIHYNLAVELYTKADKETREKELAALKSNANNELAAAIPYLKKADEIRPDDMTVLNSLKTIYYYLKYDTEYLNIQKRITDLGK
jgi:tetratricopeptide (TPR) repeat protein